MNDEFDEFEEKQLNAEMYEESFKSKDFKELIEQDAPKPELNENQQIYMDCIAKLKVGTFHNARFKAFNKGFRGYFVDAFGMDIFCPLNKREFYNWAFGEENNEDKKTNISWYEKLSDNEKKQFMFELERKIVRKPMTVLITANQNLKVDGLSIENLIRVSWTGKNIYCNNIRIENYIFLTDYEKSRISDFIEALGVEYSTREILYHKSFLIFDEILIPFNEVKIEPRLLPESYYKTDTYQPREYIDPENPNFIMDEMGNITSERYTQMLFYQSSSTVKLTGSLNCLK
jgi:hypothetical protein